MKVVVIASEAVPFAKNGGLPDVAGALPLALERLGHSVTLLLSCHRPLWGSETTLTATGLTLQIPVSTKMVEGFVSTIRLPHSDVATYLSDQPDDFDRE